MVKRQHKKKPPPIRTGEQATRELLQRNKVVMEVLERDACGRTHIRRQRVIDEFLYYDILYDRFSIKIR